MLHYSDPFALKTETDVIAPVLDDDTLFPRLDSIDSKDLHYYGLTHNTSVSTQEASYNSLAN